jgi:hypothetical protein
MGVEEAEDGGLGGGEKRIGSVCTHYGYDCI